MTTETIRCPGCGEEILQDVENCPYCDAPISVIMNNDISGAPIDNSAAIDAMLRSASQFMEESESLGLGELDIFDEDDEEENQKEEVFKKVTLKELPPELSEAQKDEIEAGGVINLTPEEESAPAPAPPPAPQKKRGKQKQTAVSSDGFKELEPKNGVSAAPSSPSQPLQPSAKPNAANASDNPAEAQKKENGENSSNNEPMLYEVDEKGKPIKPKKPKKPKKEKIERPKKVKKEKTKSSPAGSVIAAVIALAVGLGGGYFGKMFIFPDLPSPECQNFAQKAVNAAVEEVAGAK